MAFLGALLYNVLAMVLPVGNYWLAVYYFFYYYISINISLAVFNLLPIPPLDGSRIFAVVLPDRLNDTLARYERYIFPVMAVLLFSGILDGVLSVMNDWAFALVVGAASLPFQLFGL
jgi:Zn-dependent protease